MIDEHELLKNILYSDKWNNQPCPMWVIRMIVAWDTPVVNHTPVENNTHVMVSDVLHSNNTTLNVSDVIRYIDQLFSAPCSYLRGTMDVSDEMKHRYPYWCRECWKHSPLECWRMYFELRKEEEWVR